MELPEKQPNDVKERKIQVPAFETLNDLLPDEGKGACPRRVPLRRQ